MSVVLVILIISTFKFGDQLFLPFMALVLFFLKKNYLETRCGLCHLYGSNTHISLLVINRVLMGHWRHKFHSTKTVFFNHFAYLPSYFSI